jgi:AmmeMemoRadiSam system protein B
MNIRPSPIAGTWYPGHPDRLKRTINEFLDKVDTAVPKGKIWGVVAPHAGYRYSGQVAAHAFACLRTLQPELVVVISPLHSMHAAPLLTSAHDAYETPLGLVEVDRTAVTRLDQALRKSGLGLTAVANDQEHSLEIELPYLQQVLDDFKLLPIMIRDQSGETVHKLAQALAETITDVNAVLVASSDLSHFYPQPLAAEFDTAVLNCLDRFDPQGILRAEDERTGFACGRGAIAAALWAAKALGANQVDILNYATSGDATGKFDSVVGYGAAVIWESDLN